MSVGIMFGLGRAGLPQALVAAESGMTIYGIEKSRDVVQGLLAGQATFSEPGLSELLESQLGKRFFPMVSSELSTVADEAEYVVIAIGLPQRKDLRLASRALKALTDVIDDVLSGPHQRGVTFIVRCATTVGTTDRLRDHIQQVHGLVESQDYYLAYVPERLAEGKAIQEERTLPCLIGTYTDEAFARASSYFEGNSGTVRRLSSPAAAEFAKLADNSYRDLHFAFANELAYVADATGLDVAEIIAACNAEYPRNNIPLPGPVSGYCLSKDPWILDTGFQRLTGSSRSNSLFASGRRVNEELVPKASATLAGMLGQQASTPRIAILGLSYKEDIDDFRSSHALAMAHRLRELLPGARLVLYDPGLEKSIYSQLPISLGDVVERTATELTPEVFDGVDGVLIATRHSAIRLSATKDGVEALLARASRPVAIYDCWNVWRSAELVDGVRYQALGKGGGQ